MKISLLVACALAATGLAGAQFSPRTNSQDCSAGLQLPPGFCATVFAEGVSGARHIVVAPNGDVFVKTEGGRRAMFAGGGGIVALRDTNRDGKSDVRQQFGDGGGTGIALDGTSLYATSGNSIVRYNLPAGAMTPAGKPDIVVMDLPMSGSHHSHNFVLAGRTLFVNIGSASNVCQERDRRAESPGNNPCTELNSRAGIWEFNAVRLNQRQSNGRRFATGLRNSVAFTRSPLNGFLYATVHGRDQLHDNWPNLFSVERSAENPGEELVRIDAGRDYGWPYCYYDVDQRKLLLAPEYGGDGRTAGLCTTKTEPLMAFPGHWAPNGMLFYSGSQFPPEYRGGAFVAFHGSWNRAPLPQAGYRIAFVPFRDNRPTGPFTTFADGFNPATVGKSGRAHRPVGLAQAPDGSLFVTDDAGGTVWRITYSGNLR